MVVLLVVDGEDEAVGVDQVHVGDWDGQLPNRDTGVEDHDFAESLLGGLPEDGHRDVAGGLHVRRELPALIATCEDRALDEGEGAWKTLENCSDLRDGDRPEGVDETNSWVLKSECPLETLCQGPEGCPAESDHREVVSIVELRGRVGRGAAHRVDPYIA